MELPLFRKLCILFAIWLSLILTTLLTDTISKLVTPLAWIVHSIIVGVTFTCIKIWNRSHQEPLLDVGENYLEIVFSAILAVLVSIFGGAFLHLHPSISKAQLLILVIVMTATQFTLLKSVQPDPASPTHGFNRIVSVSKPIYFILLASISLACESYVNSPYYANLSESRPSFVLYNFDIFDEQVISSIGNASFFLILSFPVIFIFGLLPQITTFIIYLLEQIDIHCFGSTASTLGLKSAFYSFARSSLAILFLFLVALQAVGNQRFFSLLCGLVISIAYFLSRNSSDVTIACRIFKKILSAQSLGWWSKLNPSKQPGPEKIELDDLRSPATTDRSGGAVVEDTSRTDEEDSNTNSITTRIQSSIDDVCANRLKKDLIRCLCTIIIVFALHVTNVFNSHHDRIERYLGNLSIIWGIFFHFAMPQFRRDIPCMCLAKPVLRPREYNLFEVKAQAKLMWFEKVYYFGRAFEKNFIYPMFWLNSMTKDSTTIKEMYGPALGSLILVVTSFKLIRASFNDSSPNYLTIIFAQLFFNYDVATGNHRIFIINYFVFSILHVKVYELFLKLQFIYVYIAPWQISWGSAFHAFAQPFSVPHSALLFCQAILSSILSAPLQPIFGSAIFLMSYVRPVKFWERDYNTNVVDINSTRLVTQLERNRIDSNRLDGIFYEHLTKCLQRKLCRDISLGRWGSVSQGDCFIMASDNLNCLVHIIELGNGLCTFQLRGLEFRGTYCQQQEVEAITEGVARDDGFCCCEPGRLPYFLSANAAFDQFWLAWHVTHARYVLEGYSISDNLAGPMLQPFELRRALITYYVKAIIYFTVTSPHLPKWLQTTEFHDALEHTKDEMYADLDPTFSLTMDLDFDLQLSGVTRSKFCSAHFEWIKYCFNRVKNDKKETARAEALADLECTPESFLVSLCYGLSLIARRSLSAAADGQQFHTVDSLLFGLHALLKGDFRVTSLHDEWIFQEMRFFKLVVIPAVRMALKLHQDHFAAPDDYEDNLNLFEAIAGYQKNLVISHETDVAWRAAVLSGVPSLLTLRFYTDDGSNQYKFIMLNRRYLSFRIVKINRECVRGLWSSQQQELIFFRNTDPERGSIQNAKQALRNMINSSCDQPVGYPIYVSPLTTSYYECGTITMDLSRNISK